METPWLLILLLIGLAAGMLSGLIGVGGGVLIIPGLVYFLGYSQKMAQGTSLGILLLPVGILAVLQYHKSGYVDIKAVLLVATGFILGGWLGSKVALALPQETLKKVFAVILLIISLKMLFEKKKVAPESPVSTTVEKNKD